MTNKLFILGLSTLFLSGCTLIPNNSTNQTPTPTPTPTAVQFNTMKKPEELLNLKAGQKISATIKTSMGDIAVDLFPDKAPNTVANFVGLSEGTKDWTDPKTGKNVSGKSLYAGVVFHRIIKGFMIQSGDPLGTGTGGPGYKFADEKTDEPYTRGTLAMANSGPNTNGSQFFIMHEDGSLPPAYTVFGRVNASDSASLATLDKIANVKTVSNGMGETSKPAENITIESVNIQRK